MGIKRTIVVAILLFASPRIPAQGNGDAVTRFPPSAFKALPTAIIRQLESRQCAIPQEHFSPQSKPNNVIPGEFAKKGQADWAVLCSAAGKSSIFVMWEKPTACPSELASSEDRNYLQSDERGSMVFSRRIRLASQVRLRRIVDSSARNEIDHEGIEDAFVGKGSTVFYCTEGKWKEIAASD